MIEKIYIGGCPSSEQGISTDRDGLYVFFMEKEVDLFKKALREKFPIPDSNCKCGFKKEWSDSSVGTRYAEVVAWHDDRDEKAVEWAFMVDGVGIQKWNECSAEIQNAVKDVYAAYKCLKSESRQGEVA